MTYIETEAIVIRREPYRSSGFIVTFLTKSIGKIRVIVNGANSEKSGMTGYFEPINILYIQIQDKGNGFFSFLSASYSKHLLIYDSYVKSLFQLASAELIDQWIIQDFESEFYFNLVISYCNSVKTSKYPPFMLFLRFIFRAISASGVPINIFIDNFSIHRDRQYLFNIKENRLELSHHNNNSENFNIVLTDNDIRLANKICNTQYDNTPFPSDIKKYFFLYKLLKKFIIFHINSKFSLANIELILSSKKNMNLKTE